MTAQPPNPMRSLHLIALVILALGLAFAASAQPADLPRGFDVADPFTVQAADHGVVTGQLVDNTPALQRALDAAVYGRPPGRWARVVLPPDTTYYRGQLRIDADSLQIVGCGGAVVTEDTARADAPVPGLTYYPVRRVDRVDPKACVSVVRVLPGAFAGEPAQRSRATRWMVVNRDGGRGRPYSRLSLQDFVMDGNLDGNRDGLQAIVDDGRGSTLQNAVHHTALAANGHDRNEMCESGSGYRTFPGGFRIYQQGITVGTLIEVKRVVVTGYAATGLVGNRCTRWLLDTVRAEDTPYNHPLYHTDGGIAWDEMEQVGDMGPLSAWGGSVNVTLAGSAWTYWSSQAGVRITNLVFEEPSENALRRNDDLLNPRWGRMEVRGFAAGDALPRGFKDEEGGTVALDADGGFVPEVYRPSATVEPEPVRPPRAPEPDPAPSPDPDPSPEQPEAPRYELQTITYDRCRDVTTGRYVKTSLCEQGP